MTQKALFIIPYRDRETHLKILIPVLVKHCNKLNYEILVIEQSSFDQFNRGMLCNIGFNIALKLKKHFDYCIFHDVDLCPKKVNYEFPKSGAAHISTFVSQFSYEIIPNCFGGVSSFSKNAFIGINGFSNGYWGWGSEDDDLRDRANSIGLKVSEENGYFKSLEHDKNGWQNTQSTSIPAQNFKRLLLTRAKFINSKNDGLNNLNYELLRSENFENYTHFLVKLTRNKEKYNWANIFKYLKISFWFQYNKIFKKEIFKDRD